MDQVIGCGQRHGNKFFLVRFIGESKNEIIDWETAKEYSIDIMEFFASRTVWTEMRNIIDPDINDELPENEEYDGEAAGNMSTPSTSQMNTLNSSLHDIEFEK